MMGGVKSATHLFFTEDSLKQMRSHSKRSIKSIIFEFSNFSGLNVNVAKSSMVFSTVYEPIKQNLLDIGLRQELSSLPFIKS